ncbi:MAG: hypothetical protein ABS75_25950 [Pelagibacterium sp. SCN 63-23]|nr:MAG: hypothetical protein ABS75_25950 [Pelagibacterium sp. SCN 63-23]
MTSISDSLLSAAQCRGARGMLTWTMEDLSARAGIARRTLQDFESERRVPHVRNLERITSTFNEAGITFLRTDKGEGVLVTLPPETAP